MQHRMIGLIIFSAGSFFGCGNSAPPATLPSPHHGGNLVELAESKGYVEIGTERGLHSKTAAKGQNLARIIAYFYQPDATTTMSPPPTDVKLTIGAAGTGTVVALVPDPQEAGQFVSEPGTYPDELRGKIEFHVGGTPIQASFSFR
jgi:hypothetical protein